MIKKVCQYCGKEFLAKCNRTKYCSKECYTKFRTEDITGKTFGYLTVIAFKGSNKGNGALWLCKCKCGNEIITTANGLKNGHAKSCGCLRKENLLASHTTHNLSNTRIYKIWVGMKRRCNDIKNIGYKLYGNRGIKVCDEWLNFENFYSWSINNGYKNDLSIDRIDNNKGYSPDNCRWVNMKIQQRNRRNNHYITINGETRCLKEWSEIYHRSVITIWYRINKLGWDEVRAVTTPVKKI